MKKYSVLLLFVLIASLLFTKNVFADEIPSNTTEQNLPTLVEFFNELNNLIFIDERSSYKNYIEMNFIEDFLTIKAGNDKILSEKINLDKTYTINDKYYLLRVLKTSNDVESETFVLYNRETNKLEKFVNHEEIFFEAYKNNEIKDADLIADLFVYFISKNNKDLATQLMKNSDDYDLFVEKDLTSFVKYSLYTRYKINDLNNYVYQYVAIYNKTAIYKYIVIHNLNGLFQVDVKDSLANLYTINDKLDKNVAKAVEFTFSLNYYKESLEENKIFQSFSEKTKEELLNSKEIYYLTNYSEYEGNFYFSIRDNQHITSNKYLETISVNEDNKEIYPNQDDSYKDESESESSNILFVIIGLLLIPLFLGVIFATITSSGGGSSYNTSYNSSNGNGQTVANIDSNVKEAIRKQETTVDTILTEKAKPTPVKTEKVVQQAERKITVDKKETNTEPVNVEVESKRKITFDE